MGSAVGMWCIPQHRHQFDFVSGDHTKVHSERLRDGNSPPGGCRDMLPWKFFLLLCTQRSILVHFGSTNSAYSTFDMLGTQQYWITGIAGNNRVAFVAEKSGGAVPHSPPTQDDVYAYLQ